MVINRVENEERSQGSHCILKLGVHLFLYLIFVPSLYSSIIEDFIIFGGDKPNFGGKKLSAEGKWECSGFEINSSKYQISNLPP